MKTTNAAPRAGERWTEDEEALLLKMNDAEAARATGRTPGAAASRRQKLGLPNAAATSGPSGAKVTPDAAKKMKNCVNDLQRVVSGAAIDLARIRCRGGRTRAVVEADDVEALRGVLFDALWAGLHASPPGEAVNAVRSAAAGPTGGRTRPPHGRAGGGRPSPKPPGETPVRGL